MDASEKFQNLSILQPQISSRSIEDQSHFYRDYLKRSVDVVFAILSLPLIIPLLLLVVLLIKLDSKGPAIFRGERIGKGGKKFWIYKLRTMCVDANDKLSEI